jgi:serine/threonine protein kinase
MNDNDKPQIFKKRYEVIKNLGSGNSGVTYLVIDLEATNELNDRKVLKVIQLNEIDCEQVAESIRQAELLSSLNNDHIIKVKPKKFLI